MATPRLRPERMLRPGPIVLGNFRLCRRTGEVRQFQGALFRTATRSPHPDPLPVGEGRGEGKGDARWGNRVGTSPEVC